MFARQRAAALMEIKKQIEANGAKILIIGSGTPEQAKTFAENFNVELDIYVDESLQTYNAFSLERGFFKTLGWKSLKCGVRAIQSGFHQGLSARPLATRRGICPESGQTNRLSACGTIRGRAARKRRGFAGD